PMSVIAELGKFRHWLTAYNRRDPMAPRTEWSGGLHLSYRLIPGVSDHLKTFLSAENGTPWQEIHAALPYDSERAGAGAAPDPRRYRDPKQLYETAGF